MKLCNWTDFWIHSAQFRKTATVFINWMPIDSQCRMKDFGPSSHQDDAEGDITAVKKHDINSVCCVNECTDLQHSIFIFNPTRCYWKKNNNKKTCLFVSFLHVCLLKSLNGTIFNIIYFVWYKEHFLHHFHNILALLASLFPNSFTWKQNKVFFSLLPSLRCRV